MQTAATMTRDEQRAKKLKSVELAFRLQLRLRGLVRRVLGGDTDPKLTVEFQELVQYASPETKGELMDLIRKGV